MLGYQNGNLSDSSSDTSAASQRTNNHEGCLVNADSNGIFTEKVVSRKHGKLTFENGRFFVVNLNSSGVK